MLSIKAISKFIQAKTKKKIEFSRLIDVNKALNDGRTSLPFSTFGSKFLAFFSHGIDAETVFQHVHDNDKQSKNNENDDRHPRDRFRDELKNFQFRRDDFTMFAGIILRSQTLAFGSVFQRETNPTVQTGEIQTEIHFQFAVAALA